MEHQSGLIASKAIMVMPPMGGAPQIKTMSINEKIIRTKIGLLNLAEELGNVSKACQMMGLSRDTFYRYKSAMEQGGVDALLDKNRRVPNRKNRVDERIEERV
jgi:molybdenum-dependent DNA-binding transcriptional regulator ModE